MKIEKQIDDLMHQIDWDSVTDFEKSFFANSILTLEIGFREKEKSNSILSSQYISFLSTMIMLLIMLIFSCEPLTMLVSSVFMQMIFFIYNQVINWMTHRIFEKVNVSLLNFLQTLQKKHPLV